VTAINRDARFWISVAIFQAAFGLAVFAITRNYYVSRPAAVDAAAVAKPGSLPLWPGTVAGTDALPTGAPMPPTSTSTDPAEISRQADEAFSASQYDRAAALYEQLLTFDAKNVETYNNLGITLHYLGRSAEALQKLNAGLALDPTHQRSWLTLGYVSSQVGNTEQARKALNNAAQMGTDEEIRQSAQKMLEGLPKGE
jgi:tetratricopeptide (TPR) repeat protein